MLSKRFVSNLGDDSSDMDEGWWASILADEEAYATPQKNAAPKSASSGLVTVDWQRVQTLYENDEVVSLQVYGYNRGGVLVQGEGIQGFVPVSHLVDMPCNAGKRNDARCSMITLGAFWI